MNMQFFPANERGHMQLHWLKTFYTFSFGQYYDPKKMGFGPLRVLNDDTIAAKSGFPEHPHKDMEIMTFVLEGEITHRDSAGGSGVTRAGEMQIMTAGKGVQHSEINYHELVPCKLFQIWVQPNLIGLEPSYAKHDFAFGTNAFTEVIGPNANVQIHQDMAIKMGAFDGIHEMDIQINRGAAFLFVIDGQVQIGDVLLNARDAIGISGIDSLALKAKDARVMLFDLQAD